MNKDCVRGHKLAVAVVGEMCLHQSLPHGQEVRACPRMPKSVMYVVRRGERAYIFSEYEWLLSTLVLLRFRQCHVKKNKTRFLCVIYTRF